MRGLGNDLIREARRRAGLTQQQLADRAGTTQSAVARWESGRTSPDFDAVLRLVRLCGLDLEVALVARDDSDLAQAQRLRSLPPADRLERGVAVARQLRALKGALKGTSRAAE